MGSGMPIYLDWAATAPLSAPAIRALESSWQWGACNANSLHEFGRSAAAKLEESRMIVARCLGARSDEIYFTGSATEADNLAVRGIVQAYLERDGKLGGNYQSAHIVCSTIEHDAVHGPVKALEHAGVRVSWVPPAANGVVDPQRIEAALCDSTVLVCLMLVNNELGSIQPVKEVCALAKKHGAAVHADAVQALAKVPIDVKELGVDTLAVSAHKIGGPLGVGALYMRKGLKCAAQTLGGGQEGGLRSGTHNVPGAAAFAAVCQQLCQPDTLAHNAARLSALSTKLRDGLSAFPQVKQSVPYSENPSLYAPHITSVCVDGLESETMILRFDMLGIAVSGGSACSSHSLDPSRVLLEVGIPRDQALGALRFSIGEATTEDDIDRALDACEKALDWKGGR